MCPKSSSVSSVSGRFFIEVEIYGRHWPALIDTGATSSVINGSVAAWLRYNNITIRDRVVNLEMADGRRASTSNAAILPVVVGGEVVIVRFDVLPQMPYFLVLGVDFLKYIGAKINFRESSFKTRNGVDVPLIMPRDVSRKNPVELKAMSSESECTPAQDFTLMRFLDAELKLFDAVVGRTNIVKHRIVLDDTPPIKQRYYPVSPVIQKAIDEQVNEMLSNDIIEPSNSSWSSPVLLVPKKDGSKRFVVDFRKVNSLSKKDAYPLPYISSILDKLRAGKYISTIDLEKGYWQVELEESSREITAFTIPGRGLFHFKVMPFGLHSAGATFQRLMDKVISAELEPNTFAYLDDIVVVSSTFEEHLKHLGEVFARLRKAGLKINVEKCQFVKPRLKFLGYVVGNGELEMDPEKVAAVVNYPSPTNTTELRRFLGFVGWYRKFVPSFSSVAAPLTDSLKQKNKKFHWGKEQDVAFARLKEHLLSAPILACPHFDIPFTVECDASGVGIGGVLTQKIDGKERVIAYCSRTLSASERNYSATERECLAVLFAISKFKQYIEGYRFSVVTDHASLRWLANFANPQGRLARWIAQLQQYDCEIIHRKGSFHVVPDALSRIGAVQDDEELDTRQNLGDAWYAKLWHKAKKSRSGHPGLQLSGRHLYRKDRDGSWKMLVPESLRPQILEENHASTLAGHMGFRKTLRKIRDFYSWPNLRKDVNDFVRRCRVCQRYKVEQAKPAGLMRPHEMVRPWTIVASDIIGPLPKSLKGNRYLLVFLDTATRWPIAIPLRSVKAVHVANLMRTEVINHWGCPDMVLTDNGPQYVSRVLKKMCDMFEIKLCHTAPYFPQANPCERTNRSLKNMIAMFCEDSHRKWDESISDFMFALRTAVSETTGFSPAELNFGRKLRKPKDLYRESDLGEVTEFEPRSYAERLQKSIKAMISRAAAAQRKASEKQAHYYNLRRREVEYPCNTLVWRKNFPKSAAGEFSAAKLEPKFVGPYLIKRRVTDSMYDLVTPNGKVAGRWHVRDLKPAY